MVERRKQHQRGSSLVTVIVALGVGVVACLAIADLLVHGYQTQKRVELRSDLVSMRDYVSSAFDCDTTAASITSSDCRDKPAIAILSKRASPKDVVVALVRGYPHGTNYTKLGRYVMRALCIPCDKSSSCPKGKKIEIDAALMNNKGEFLKDPLTGKPVSWTDLFKEVPIDCTIK